MRKKWILLFFEFDDLNPVKTKGHIRIRIRELLGIKVV